MEQSKFFHGQNVSTPDLINMNDGFRKSILQTHTSITNNNGGVINGLEVSVAINGLSLTVNSGVFYTSGTFSDKNNFGGGERAELFTPTSISNFPETAPILNQPSYILLYAKIITSNINPDLSKSQALITSKNLQTGEDIPTREYSKAVVIITNPLLRSTIQNIDGVPLAIFQVNYDGITKVHSDNSITLGDYTVINNIITTPLTLTSINNTVDVSVRKNYTIGGTVDVANKVLLDAGVPDDFITDRMFSDSSISTDKLQDESVTTSKIASADTSDYNDLTGSGVANQQIKNDAVTGDKINHNLGLNGFNTRNLLLNSSFEIPLSSDITKPENWTVTTIESPLNSVTLSTIPKFGTKSLLMAGGLIDATHVTHQKVIQIVDFNNENVANVSFSAFFWAKQIVPTTSTGTDAVGLEGTITFFDSSDTAVAGINTFIFGLVPFIAASSDYIQYSTTSPIIYTGTGTPTKIKFSIGDGPFDGHYQIDGAFLGKTDHISNFDVNPSEYTNVGLVDFSDLSGKLSNSQVDSGTIDGTKIIDNTITSAKLNSVNGSKIDVTSIDGSKLIDNSIDGAKIISDSVDGSKIKNNTITATQLDDSISFVPKYAIILWDHDNTCPAGFTEVEGLKGRFPLGKTDAGDLSAVSTTLNGQASDSNVNNTGAGTPHHHTVSQGPQAASGSAANYSLTAGGSVNTSDESAHTHTTEIPLMTVLFCRKD